MEKLEQYFNLDFKDKNLLKIALIPIIFSMIIGILIIVYADEIASLIL